MWHNLKRGTSRIARVPTRLSVLILMASSLAAGASAQTAEQSVVSKVEAAFSHGDASALLRYAADRVEIAVLGSSTLYSRAQATYVLNDFFREYPPVRFAATEPAATTGNFFVAGRYWYGSGEDYLDVYIRFRSRDGAYEVRELRIERPVR